MMRQLPLVLLLLASDTVFAQVPSTRLDSLFNHLARASQTVGSIAISQKGRIVYAHSVDHAAGTQLNIRTADSLTLYRIGSVTKMYTAVLLMQLVEEGKLALSTPLHRFFPQVPGAEKITVEMMLRHRSGLANFTDDLAFQRAQAYKAWSRKDLLAYIASLPPAFPPDSTAAYSNSGYILLGYIIEDLRGAPYAQVVENRILRPLGLRHTRYSTQPKAPDEARSLGWTGTAWEAQLTWHGSVVGAAGALAATAPDAARFADALFYGRLISAQSLRTLQTKKAGGSGLMSVYGMGVFPIPFYEHTAWGHTGGIDGYHTVLCHFPADSLSVAFCMAGQRYPMNDILVGVLSAVFNKPYALPDFSAPAAVSEAVLRRYEGTWVASGFPLKLTLRVKEGGLFAQAPGQGEFPLQPKSDTVFFFDGAGITLTFSEGKSGGWNTMAFSQGGIALTLTKEQ